MTSQGELAAILASLAPSLSSSSASSDVRLEVAAMSTQEDSAVREPTPVAESATAAKSPGSMQDVFEALSQLTRAVDESNKQINVLTAAVANNSNRMDESNKQMNVLTAAVANNSNRMDDMKKDVKAIGDVGSLSEFLYRSAIKENYGKDFARPFHVTDLYGLARLALPKNTDNDGDPISGAQVTITHTNRARALAAAALKQAPVVLGVIIARINELSEDGTKLRNGFSMRRTSDLNYYNKLKAEIESVMAENSAEQQLMILSSTPLGLKIFCSLATTDNHPLKELELDVRGNVSIIGSVVTVMVGEIKSGKGHEEALEQLLKRLAVIYEAINTLLSPRPYSYQLIGIAFFVRYNEKASYTAEDVREVANSGRIKIPITLVQIKKEFLC